MVEETMTGYQSACLTPSAYDARHGACVHLNGNSGHFLDAEKDSRILGRLSQKVA